MLPRFLRHLPIFALAGLSLLNTPVFAGTLIVPAQYPTIQAAVNASANGDTVLIADGTYTGPGNVDIDFNGRNITVTSQNGAATTVIDCQGSYLSDHRGFFLHSSETNAIISGLTIKNGYETYHSNGTPSDGRGGAIFGRNVGLLVENCVISNSTAYYGGGMFAATRSSTTSIGMTNCTINSNTATQNGGGVFNDAYISSGSLSLTGCLVQNNSTGTNGFGGGIYNSNSGGNNGPIGLTNCAIANNKAGEGGGIYNIVSGASLVNIVSCAVISNQATTSYGEGIFSTGINGGFVTLTNCTLTGNAGGGIYYTSSLSFTLSNDILYGDLGAEITIASNQVSGTASFCDIQGGYAGTNNINADPLFVNPAGDLHLQSSSPCLGMGTSSGAPTTTLDGQTRPAPPSIGAYEASGTLVNDTGFGIVYSGSSWGYYPGRGSGDFRDDVHATYGNGDSVSYTFTGTAISYIAETNYDEGNVQVYLDGALQATVSGYSATRKSQQTLWSKNGLPSGSHTIMLVKQDGQYLLLDAFLVSPALPTSSLINDTSFGITYSGTSWQYQAGRGVGDFSDDVHDTPANGDSISYSFTGTAISYIAETCYDEGNVQVYLDGTYQATVSGYSVTRRPQQTLWSTSGLSNAGHTLTLVKASGNVMILDAFQISPALTTSTTVNDTSTAISYAGNWYANAHRGIGDYSDDVHDTSTNGDSASYTFTGTSISYIAETCYDEGNVQVYLDGALQATVSGYSSTRKAQQTLWSKSGLAAGSHTIKIVKASGNVMLLDAFNYQ